MISEWDDVREQLIICLFTGAALVSEAQRGNKQWFTYLYVCRASHAIRE